MHRLVILIAVALCACPPKRVEPATPIVTRLAPPDGGPFDIVPLPKEDEPPPVSGDMRHLNKAPGQPGPR